MVLSFFCFANLHDCLKQKGSEPLHDLESIRKLVYRRLEDYIFNEINAVKRVKWTRTQKDMIKIKEDRNTYTPNDVET